MKRKGGLLLLVTLMCLALSPLAVFAHNGVSHSGVKLNLNGTNVFDSSASIKNGRVYGSVKTFSTFYGTTYAWQSSTKTLKIKEKTVAGAFQTPNGVLVAPVVSMAKAIGNFTSGWDQKSKTANVTVLPEGVIKLTPAVPQMGEHWANPKNMPLGPIFGLYNGKLIFIEVMPAKDLDKTIHDIPGTGDIPIPIKVDHFDIDWEPNGHEGFLVPHYDIHEYFISREEQNQIH
jgi:hypothetical protein